MRLVIEHLQALGEGTIKPENPTEGIYYEIKHLFGGGAMEEVMQYATKWEFFSGDIINPIQCPYGGQAEARLVNTKALWSKTQYASWRRALCRFLAHQLRLRYGV